MAGVAIIWGILGLAFKWTDEQTAFTAIWGGLATFGIRRAIGK